MISPDFTERVEVLRIRFVFCFLCGLLFVGSVHAAHIMVVHPPMFRDSLQPWIQYRSEQGHTIHLLETNRETGEADILAAIRNLAHENPLEAVLLVGDTYSPSLEVETIPSPRIPAKVIGQFGKEQDIASDTVYGDLDDDGLPDITVGRFSVQSAAELDAMIRKTIRYENRENPGPWLRRINFIAGVGGFSAILDGSIESAARFILSQTIPAEYDITLTQSDVKSPYCPAPSRFRNETIARLNEGSLFWVYMGHGMRQRLDSVSCPEQPNHIFPIFSKGDAEYVSCSRGLPIALLLCCYTGALDSDENCVAEELHRRENGPVAVFAASRTTMPYGMCTLGIELIEETFKPRTSEEPLTLGNVILTAKRNSMLRKTARRPNGKERPIREVVDSLAKMLDPTANRLEEQRFDHVHLFQLFGDPLLRLPTPITILLDAPETAKANTTINVRGVLPDTGKSDDGKMVREKRRVVVELAVPKARNTVFSPKNRTFDLTEESVQEFNTLYAEANRRVVSRVIIDVPEGRTFSAELPIPGFSRNEKGDYDLRVYYETANSYGLGSRTISVK